MSQIRLRSDAETINPALTDGHLYRLVTGELVVVYENYGIFSSAVVIQPGRMEIVGATIHYVDPKDVVCEEYPLSNIDRDYIYQRACERIDRCQDLIVTHGQGQV
jgi:hypothetical protein